MKNRILAAIRAVVRPIAAKLFPEQFKERTATEIVPVGGFNMVALKEKMQTTMRKRNSFEKLDAQSTEAAVYATIGYQQAVRDFDKLWEVALNGRS